MTKAISFYNSVVGGSMLSKFISIKPISIGFSGFYTTKKLTKMEEINIQQHCSRCVQQKLCGSRQQSTKMRLSPGTVTTSTYFAKSIPEHGRKKAQR